MPGRRRRRLPAVEKGEYNVVPPPLAGGDVSAAGPTPLVARPASATASMVGRPFFNVGNTCFLNSVLQCLLHLPAVRRGLLDDDHASMCRLCPSAFCAACALEAIACSSFDGTHGAFCPGQLTRHLSAVDHQFQLGFQQDAHEFMRRLLSVAAPQFCPSGTADAPGGESSTQRWLRGSLRSQVRCTACGRSSSMVDDFLDLSLELVNESGHAICSVVEALANFTRQVTVFPTLAVDVACSPNLTPWPLHNPQPGAPRRREQVLLRWVQRARAGNEAAHDSRVATQPHVASETVQPRRRTA